MKKFFFLRICFCYNNTIDVCRIHRVSRDDRTAIWIIITNKLILGKKIISWSDLSFFNLCIISISSIGIVYNGFEQYINYGASNCDNVTLLPAATRGGRREEGYVIATTELVEASLSAIWLIMINLSTNHLQADAHCPQSSKWQGSPLYFWTASSLHSIKESSIKFYASPHWTQVLTLMGWQVFFFSRATHLELSTT